MGSEMCIRDRDDSNAFFDLDANGFATLTSWVSADDAILAIDNNGDGIINDITELFGDATTFGFTELSTHDSNGDGKIDAQDQTFSDLLLWNDLNGDGVSQAEELTQLSSSEVASINLAYDSTGNEFTTAGRVAREGTFTRHDGTDGLVGDVEYAVDGTYSNYVANYAFFSEVLAVEDIQGYGTLPNLHIAMSLDEDFRDYALDLLDNANVTTLVDNFMELMIRWGGLQDVSINDLNPTGELTFNAANNTVRFSSAGETFTVPELGVLLAYTGEQNFRLDDDRWQDTEGGVFDLQTVGGLYRQGLNELTRNLLAKFAVGNGLLSAYIPGITYSLEDDLLVSDSPIEDYDFTSLVASLADNADNADIVNEIALTVITVTEFNPDLVNDFTFELYQYLEANQGSTQALNSVLNNDLLQLLGVSGSSADALYGSESNDIVLGNGGDDVISGLEGDDYLDGGNGDDRLHGGSGDDTLDGGAGNDSLAGGDGEDYLLGGEGDDNLEGRFGDDTLYGGNGHDELLGGGGDDVLQGEAGNDTLSGEGGIDLLFGGGGHDVLTGGDDNDLLRGDNGNDDLSGDAGNDILYGESGADLLDGGNGNDYLDGGDGVDTLSGGGGSDALTGGNGEDILRGGGGNDTLNGGNGIDTLSGGDGNDALLGENGNDFLNGNDGNDTLEGNDGFDTLDGGQGDDILHGGNGVDTLIGGGGADELLGGNGNDLLNGSSGNDALYGDNGDDSLDGGSGADTLYGGHNHDNLTGGSGNDLLFGENGNDVLDGGTGNDTLDAGNGHDILAGGKGADVLTGHWGNDTFVYNQGDGADTITDFGAGNDLIDLTGTSVTDFTSLNIQSVANDDGTEDAFIRFGPQSNGNNLTLDGVVSSSLDEDDFLFG